MQFAFEASGYVMAYRKPWKKIKLLVEISICEKLGNCPGKAVSGFWSSFFTSDFEGLSGPF